MIDSFISEAAQRARMFDEQRTNAPSPFVRDPKSHFMEEGFEATRRRSRVDEELEELLASRRSLIKVVGCGGAGNNTINRISDVGVEGADIIALNTDAQDLLYTNAAIKILLGKDLTTGLGTGSNPELGFEAARESEAEIREVLKGAHMVFITAGLGGGTGTGSAPVVAEIAKKMSALTVAVVTLPFSMEGQKRFENALWGLQRLENVVDTLIVVPNDKLLELSPDLPVHVAFKLADEILTNAVKGITELITKPGLINLDFADIKAIMTEGGVALIGLGESDSDKRADEAVQKAITNPLVDVNIDGGKGALINVQGGPNMTLDEVKQVVSQVTDKLDPNAKIIFGAQILPDLQNLIRVMLVITGVQSPQIFGPKHTISSKKKTKLSEDLGIDFIDGKKKMY